MDSLTLNGLRIHVSDSGDGPPLLLAHCSSASHRQWASLIEAMADRYRVIAPDLIGYGDSDPWPPGKPFAPSADADVLVALARKAGEPIHLAGHSYGAAMALEAARRLGDQIVSLTLVEPVSFHLLRRAERTRAWERVAALGRGIRSAMRAGRPRRAASLYMGFWIGRVRWLLMPRNARAAIIGTIGKVAHEFGAMERVAVPLRAYADLRAPTRLIVGERTRPPARAVIEVLASVLPCVDVQEIPGAGHMSPYTHRDAVNRLLAAHVDACRAEAAHRRTHALAASAFS